MGRNDRPRVWMLERDDYSQPGSSILRANGPALELGERPAVIERAPIATALKAARRAPRKDAWRHLHVLLDLIGEPDGPPPPPPPGPADPPRPPRRRPVS